MPFINSSRDCRSGAGSAAVVTEVVRARGRWVVTPSASKPALTVSMIANNISQSTTGMSAAGGSDRTSPVPVRYRFNRAAGLVNSTDHRLLPCC